MLANSGHFLVILAAMMACFSAVVFYLRLKTKIMYGDGGNIKLTRARAVHYNLVENALPFLLLLMTFEILDGDKACIMYVGYIFVFARILHVITTYWLKPDHMVRAIAFVISNLAQIYLIVKICLILCNRTKMIA